MGGGLFGTPLYLNPKCLVFSAFVLGVYWLPHPVARAHQIATAIILALAAYILMAHYDYLYDCNDKFGPSFLGWMTGWLKPKEYQEKYKQLPIKYQKMVRTVDIVAFVGILALLAFPFFVKSR